MKINKLICLMLIFAIFISPINSSNMSGNITEMNQNNTEQVKELNDPLINISNISLIPPVEINGENKTLDENLENREINEKLESKYLERPDGKTYFVNQLTQEKYEVIKTGNGEYEFISIKDGEKFHFLQEINVNLKALTENSINQNNEIKLKEGFKERLNLLESNKIIRLLITLKTDSVGIQKEVTKIEDKYSEEENNIKNNIRNISSRYSPETKQQARDISLSNEIIEIPEKDLNIIKEKGKELDSIKEEKINKIKEKLFSENEKSKDIFINWVEDNGGKVKRNLDRTNMVSIEVLPILLNEILNRQEVISVELDENLIEPKLDISTPTVGVSNWWNLGYKGGWIDVAVVDSGIDEMHPALATDSEGFTRTFISQDFTSSGTTDDTYGHGTHVAGIIASSDLTYKGIAPGVDLLINAKHLGGVSSDTLAALDWAITNPIGSAEILSNSWGLAVENCDANSFSLGDGDTISWTKYIDAVVDYYDVISVNAAGNDGLCGTYSLTPPADSYNSIVVGAIDDKGTISRSDDSWLNEPGWFASSVGPTWDGRKKPDITAPGLYIKSANNDWEEGFLDWNPDFVELSGTSMAAPQVSGAANLLLEYGLSSKGTKALLINTAEDKGTSSWDAYYGWGEINLNNAYTYRDYVIDGTVNEGSYKLYKVQLILVGEKATLVWNRHVTYAGATTPSTLYDLNDLDLELYQESDGEIVDGSFSIKDNVEQINSPSQFLDGIVKVNAYTTDFSNGINTESYSLSTEGGYTLANGPSLSIIQNIPSNTTDTGFTITADVLNTGDLDAHNIIVTLNLPSGLTTSSLNPQNIGSVTDGSSGTATWDININSLGTFNNIYSSFTSINYGEYSSGTSSTDSIIVTDDDTTGPSFANWVFPVTNKTYNGIDISIDITDDSGISSAILHYDYGNDGSEDGTMEMSNFWDTYSATIPPAGNTYRNQNVSYYIVGVDNDGDRTGDTASEISETKLTFLENEAPFITSFEPVSTTPSVDEGGLLVFNFTATDLDGDNINPTWLFDSVEQEIIAEEGAGGRGGGGISGSWTYSPDYAQAGDHNVTLIISDGLLVDSQEWTVSVNNINQPPVWVVEPQNQIIDEDTSLSYNISAINPDEDATVTYSVNDTEFNMDLNTGSLSWTPAKDWNGIKMITLTASDGIDNAQSEILITVNPINDAPVLDFIDNITVNETDLIELQPTANDVDGDSLTFIYSLPVNSSGAWQTLDRGAGTYVVTVTVSDGKLSDSQEVNIIVSDLCLPIWVEVLSECQSDESLVESFIDSSNCYEQKNLGSDMEGKSEDIIYPLSCDSDGDGFIGETNNINTTLQNITKEVNETFIKLNENDNPLIEFEFNLTEEQINLANLFIEKQDNESSYSYMLIRGLDLTSQNQTKTVYLDRILNGTGVCIKDEELSSIDEISGTCKGTNEVWVPYNSSNKGYNCSLVNNDTQYKISGLKHSGIKEQETYCGDGIVNGNEECEIGNIPKSCGDYGFNAGSLSCTASCTIDSSGCYTQDTNTGGGGGGSGSYFPPKNNITNQTIATETTTQNETESETGITEGESEETVGGAGITGAVIGALKGKGYWVIGFIIAVVIAFVIFNFKKTKHKKIKHSKEKKKSK